MGKKQWTIVLRSLWGKYWQIFHRQTDLEDTLLSKHTSSRFPTIINWCFLSGTRRKYADISVFTLTVSKKRKGKKKSSTTYNDHTVPSCPRQTNPGSPFPQNWFLSACSKKMKCIWCSTEKHREFVWGMCIKREAPSLTHFFVSCPLSLSFSHAHTYANLQNSVHVQTQLHLQMCKHTSPHIYTL